jgi:FMN reductase
MSEPQTGPLVVGIGGSGTPGSATERALTTALDEAQRRGARVRLFGGAFLSGVPMFQPRQAARVWPAVELLDCVAMADGVILATPSYHGGVSALVKNALDYLEDLRAHDRPYLDGRAVGCVVTSAGAQAGGTTLAAMRSIVHALRGWPTPLGVTLNTAEPAADHGAESLRMMATQVVEFATLFGAVGARR